MLCTQWAPATPVPSQPTQLPCFPHSLNVLRGLQRMGRVGRSEGCSMTLEEQGRFQRHSPWHLAKLGASERTEREPSSSCLSHQSSAFLPASAAASAAVAAPEPPKVPPEGPAPSVDTPAPSILPTRSHAMGPKHGLLCLVWVKQRGASVSRAASAGAHPHPGQKWMPGKGNGRRRNTKIY